MKAIAVSWLAYHRLFPIQKWVGIATLVFAAIAVFARPAFVLVIVAGVCFAVAVMIPAGWFLRVLSQSRNHSLLPHFRGRMLATVVLLTLSQTLLLGALFGFLAMRVPPSIWLLAGTLFAFVSLALWFTMFAPWSVIAVALAAVSFASLPPWAGELHAGVPLLAIGALWIAFGYWYLRALRIAPMPPLGDWMPAREKLLATLERYFADTSGTFSPSSATQTYLSGNYPPRHRLAGLGATMLIAAALGADLFLAVRVQRPAVLLTFLVMIQTTVAFAATNAIARRARTLWLHAGNERAELFTIVERDVRGKSPRIFFGLVLILMVVVGGLHGDARVLGSAAALSVSASVLAAYLGLANVRGWGLASIASFACLPTSTVVALVALLIESPRFDVIGSVVAFQVLAAFAARGVARRNWRRIDWLQFRPLRLQLSPLRGWGWSSRVER